MATRNTRVRRGDARLAYDVVRFNTPSTEREQDFKGLDEALEESDRRIAEAPRSAFDFNKLASWKK